VHEDNCTFYLYAMTTMEINVFYIQVIQMKWNWVPVVKWKQAYWLQIHKTTDIYSLNIT
jgi:hypothetical protein